MPGGGEAAALRDVAYVIEAIRSASQAPRLWPEALEAAAQFIGARFVALIFQDSAAELLELKYSTGAQQSWIAEYLRHHRRLDNVRAELLNDAEVGAAFSSGDFLTRELFQRSSAFQRWLAPHDLVDVAGAVIHRTQAGACLFVVFLDRETDANARARIEALSPALADAASGSRAAAARDRQPLLEELFSQLASPTLIVDSNLSIVYANQVAKMALAERGALSAVGEALVVRDPQAQAQLARAVCTPGTLGETHAIMVRQGEARCCVIHLLPMSSGLTGLLMRKLSFGPPDGGAALAGLYGLTARERSVLLSITEVGGVPATARALGLSEGTVKSYLKSVFQKTGASRQADLVKLVLSLETPFLTETKESEPV